jgi:hypothetical protein
MLHTEEAQRDEQQDQDADDDRGPFHPPGHSWRRSTLRYHPDIVGRAGGINHCVTSFVRILTVSMTTTVAHRALAQC